MAFKRWTMDLTPKIQKVCVCVAEGEQREWESVKSAPFNCVHKEMPVCSTRSLYLLIIFSPMIC